MTNMTKQLLKKKIKLSNWTVTFQVIATVLNNKSMKNSWNGSVIKLFNLSDESQRDFWQFLTAKNQRQVFLTEKVSECKQNQKIKIK